MGPRFQRFRISRKQLFVQEIVRTGVRLAGSLHQPGRRLARRLARPLALGRPIPESAPSRETWEGW